MAVGTTKKTNLVIPEVMSGVLAQKMVDLIKLSPLAVVNTDLAGQGGDTLTVPYYAYIGDASDLAEGVAGDTDIITATTKTATVKKIFKAVELTDEALTTNFGDPLSEVEKQIAVALASKVEKDCYTALEGVTARTFDLSSTGTVEISCAGISKAVIDAFGEDYDGVVMFITPKQYDKIRTEEAFQHVANGQTIMTGHVGSVYGVQIVVSNRVTGTKNIMLKAGGLMIALKRDVQVETDRDILKKTTVISADRHYTAFVYDESKMAVITFKATA